MKKYLTLAITEYCNLNCVYCYEHKKTTKVMSVHTAKKILDAEFNAEDGYDEISVDFFGGEPFSEFEFIKEIFDYIYNMKTNKKFLCFASTNGTYIHDEVKEWLEQHKDYFWCGLSYDGTEKMQDVNRTKSAKWIDVDFFHNMWPEQPVKMTVSRETLPYMADGVIYLHEKGFPVSANLAFGLDWSDEEYSSLLERELLKLIEFYLEYPEIEPCTFLNRNIAEVMYNSTQPFRWCGAGVHMRAYDVNGNLYPCHFFMPVTLNNEEVEKIKTVDFSENQDLRNDKCKTCVIERCCQICYGSNYQQFGDVRERDWDLCKLNKIMVRANSYFQWKKIEKYGLEKVAEENSCSPQVLLDAIKIIQEMS